MRRVLCTFVSEDVVEVLRHFEFESFLNSLEPKVRTTVTCKDRAVLNAIALRQSSAKFSRAVRTRWDGVLRWVGVWDLPMTRAQR
jgi:hypothetical protein